MKYKNVDIGDRPSKEQFQEYITRMGFLIDVDYWYAKYDKKNWLTKKKAKIKSLEAIVNAINSIVVHRRKCHRNPNTGKKVKEPSITKKKTKGKKEEAPNASICELSFDERMRMFEELDSISNKERTRRQKLIRKALKKTFTAQELQAYQKRKSRKHYELLLKDKRWKEFRLKVMSERGDRCECCGSIDTIQIHHTLYLKNHLPWEYDIKDMRVVCRMCHQKLHHLI